MDSSSVFGQNLEGWLHAVKTQHVVTSASNGAILCPHRATRHYLPDRRSSERPVLLCYCLWLRMHKELFPVGISGVREEYL